MKARSHCHSGITARTGVARGAAGVLAGLAILVAVSAGVRAEEASADPRQGAGTALEDAELVGQTVCTGCHTIEADHWSRTIHARLAEHPRSELQALACESCHGAGSRHLADPDDPGAIIAFTRASGASAETINGLCLQCHDAGARIHWQGSVHERQELACADCHNPMAEQSERNLLVRASVSRTCFSCHPAQRHEFRKRSHMPLLEGGIECTDCHQPHGSVTDPLLRADTVNQLCHQCHAEKRGPFLWEHAPVVESCLTCHRPHGSNHERLLVAALPFLCSRCHGQVGGFSHPNDLLTGGNLAGGIRPDERLLGRACVNCHVQIHGSNHPSGARFHR